MINLSISSVGEITHFIACEGTQAVLAKLGFILFLLYCLLSFLCQFRQAILHHFP